METTRLIEILSVAIFSMAAGCIGLLIVILLFLLPFPWGGIACVSALAILCLLGHMWMGKLKQEKEKADEDD